MPMEGSSEEYEKLTLAALKKAASPDSDATYHHNRAAIFASLAMAAASAEMADALTRMSGLPTGRPSPSGPAAQSASPPARPAPSSPRSPAPTRPTDRPRRPEPGTAIVPRAPD